MEYIVVQAGGKGIRLGSLTKNKPKALVPVENLPMLFHLFQKYPDKRYIIIADYKKEVMREYLAAFAKVKYQIVEADGEGTCSGIRQAMRCIPGQKPFMLIWSDLILSKKLRLPEEYEAEEGLAQNDYIGISGDFSCRWSYRNGQFMPESSSEYGVAGLFLFSDKKKLNHVPEDGEFVRYLQQSGMKFKRMALTGTREFGTLQEYEKIKKEKCRPFNRILIEGNRLIKEPIDNQGKRLALRECAWYEKAKELGVQGIPQIYSMQPLQMEYIQGKNIYECRLSYEEKRELLKKLIAAIRRLHEADSIPTDLFSIKEAYFHKTMDRLGRIEDLVPFAREKYIRINGKMCRNIFFHKRELEKRLEKIVCDKFHFIHGDCTFSNLMLREDGVPVFIDPRGYFGFTELYGDARYDWAKLYYSIVGNYDRFNLKEFELEMNENEVFLKITSNCWEDMEEDFFAMTGVEKEEIKLLHAVIWLSLTTYSWQDYDSVCAAFYNGLLYLEEIL